MHKASLELGHCMSRTVEKKLPHVTILYHGSECMHCRPTYVQGERKRPVENTVSVSVDHKISSVFLPLY